jgi:hypothetical protein
MLEGVDSRNHTLAARMLLGDDTDSNNIRCYFRTAPYTVGKSKTYQYIAWAYDDVIPTDTYDGFKVTRFSDGALWKKTVLVKYRRGTPATGPRAVDLNSADEMELKRDGYLCEPVSFSKNDIQSIGNSVQWIGRGRPVDYPSACGDTHVSIGEPSDDVVVMQTITEGSICAVCRKRVKHLKMCSLCKKAFYCSKECQRDDWAVHKQVCK